eukprot:TRINITY_DN62442_c0_g1_i1.p5 TRINITY_DN62442_c0_g1~~TRINITY_DN62442_c0_g1_i1.p5  ORF type:complete len:100 (-),score=14.40 TRINITY_DN62442_c0_g1_i1:30-329(-)
MGVGEGVGSGVGVGVGVGVEDPPTQIQSGQPEQVCPAGQWASDEQDCGSGVGSGVGVGTGVLVGCGVGVGVAPVQTLAVFSLLLCANKVNFILLISLLV